MERFFFVIGEKMFCISGGYANIHPVEVGRFHILPSEVRARSTPNHSHPSCRPQPFLSFFPSVWGVSVAFWVLLISAVPLPFFTFLGLPFAAVHVLGRGRTISVVSSVFNCFLQYFFFLSFCFADGIRPVDEDRRDEDEELGQGGGVQDPQQACRQGWQTAQVRRGKRLSDDKKKTKSVGERGKVV